MGGVTGVRALCGLCVNVCVAAAEQVWRRVNAQRRAAAEVLKSVQGRCKLVAATSRWKEQAAEMKARAVGVWGYGVWGVEVEVEVGVWVCGCGC